MNVDGRHHFFEDPNTPSTNRGLRRPKDDDRDGLFDEDFPDDLDGDGNITTMRKKDPNGNYKEDPEDPRILVRVKPGEKGEWSMLGQEGIDNDGDGNVNEDSEGFVDPNRNLATYQASLGRRATFEAFICEARRQSKFYWRQEYTAALVNNYLREGFGRQ